MLKFLKTGCLIFIFPLVLKAQEDSPGVAIGIGVFSLINNTYSLETEFFVNPYLSVYGSLGETINKNLTPNIKEKTAVVNGNFFRLGPRLNIPAGDYVKFVFSANYIFSRFTQDFNVEVKDYYKTYRMQFSSTQNASGFSGGIGLSLTYNRFIYEGIYNISSHYIKEPGYYRNYVPGFGPSQVNRLGRGVGNYLLLAVKYVI